MRSSEKGQDGEGELAGEGEESDTVAEERALSKFRDFRLLPLLNPTKI